MCECVLWVWPAVQITSAYITSRLESMEAVLQDNLENPLDDSTMVTQQLEQMATIGRQEKGNTAIYILYVYIIIYYMYI